MNHQSLLREGWLLQLRALTPPVCGELTSPPPANGAYADAGKTVVSSSGLRVAPFARTHSCASPGHGAELLKAMFSELIEGFVNLGATGSFTAQVGNLFVHPNYYQTENIRTCPLAIPDQCE